MERARNNLSNLNPLSPTLSRREREKDEQVISCTFLSLFKQGIYLSVVFILYEEPDISF
jgi:hypothetical protein